MSVALILILTFIFMGLWRQRRSLIKQRHALALGGLSFIVMILIGLWTILESRSSTAAIGFIFLPLYASVCGFLGWLFVKWKSHAKLFIRVLAYCFLAMNLSIYYLWVKDGFRQRRENSHRDQVQNLRYKKIDENRRLIQAGLLENHGREVAWLRPQLLKHEKDDLFLIPALETPFVETADLDRLSRSEFSGVVLMVAKNLRTSPEALAVIYRKNFPPRYYHQPLAMNKNTPKEILRELFAQPEFRRSLAQNPSTPRDLLLDLSRSKDVSVLKQLLENSSVDCGLAQQTKATLDRPDLIDSYGYLKATKISADQFLNQQCRGQ